MPIYARAHQTITHIWSEDPSLNHEDPKDDPGRFARAWEQFKKTGDTKVLPYLEGQTPCLWELRSITHAQKCQIGDAMAVAAGQAQAVGLGSLVAKMLLYHPCAELVAYGLVGAKGLLDTDGHVVELKRVNGRLTAEVMEMLSYEPLIVELGLRIYEISSPDPTRGQA